MLNTPRQSALILSKGAVLDTTWPAIRDSFPDGSTTEIRFYDSSGTVITTVAGTVEPRKLVYLASDNLDTIPNGAQYELFVIDPDDNHYKYEYGAVIRREATFGQPVSTALESQPRLFKDLLNRGAVGRRWIVTAGGIGMHPVGPGFALGPDIGLLFSQAGIRYFRPMSGDSWRIKFMLYYTSSLIGPGGAGIMRCIMGCDAALTTGMSFEVEVGVGNPGQVYIGKVTGPTDATREVGAGNAVVNGEVWTVEYSDVTKTINAYEGANPTGSDPIVTWTDEDNELPHGPGFRYWGFSWDASVLATGPILLSVEAQDYV